MDNETRFLLRGAYQHLDEHGSGLTELRLVVLALVNTIQELGPEARALYEKHYEAQSQGPLRPADAVRREAIARLLATLPE